MNLSIREADAGTAEAAAKTEPGQRAVPETRAYGMTKASTMTIKTTPPIDGVEDFVSTWL